jgi:hypothetical protein
MRNEGRKTIDEGRGKKEEGREIIDDGRMVKRVSGVRELMDSHLSIVLGGRASGRPSTFERSILMKEPEV